MSSIAYAVSDADVHEMYLKYIQLTKNPKPKSGCAEGLGLMPFIDADRSSLPVFMSNIDDLAKRYARSVHGISHSDVLELEDVLSVIDCLIPRIYKKPRFIMTINEFSYCFRRFYFVANAEYDLLCLQDWEV